MKRSALPNHFKSHISIGNELYLFVFDIKYQGYIIENQISAVVIDNKGEEITDLADYVLDINNFQNLIVFDEDKTNSSKINLSFLDQLTQKAKNIV